MDTHTPGSYLHINIEAELTGLRGEAKGGRKTSMSDEISSHLPVPPTIITAGHCTEDRSLPAAGHPESCQRNTRPRAAMEEGCSRPNPVLLLQNLATLPNNQPQPLPDGYASHIHIPVISPCPCVCRSLASTASAPRACHPHLLWCLPLSTPYLLTSPEKGQGT